MKTTWLVILLTLTACAGSKQQSDERLADLDSDLKQRFPENEPGAAVLIMKGDSIVFSGAYGLADLNTKEPITTKTLFNLGSISKTFVANGILLLHEEGRLSLEDNLAKYFPDFVNNDIGSKVQIRHLLTHTSGLPDNRQVNKDTTFYLTARDEENWAPVMKANSLEFEPGSRYQYSNPAFNGLALIIGKVSGMRWQTFIEARIMKPAGMSMSTITDGPHPVSGVAHGYVKNHDAWIEDDYGEEPTFPAAGNGGVWSSVEELAKYEVALHRNTFLKKETIEDSRTIKTFDRWQDPASPRIGWSWFIEEANGLVTVGHSGSQGGFLANYVTIPEKKIFFVILSNAPRDEYGMPETSQRIMLWLKSRNWFD